MGEKRKIAHWAENSTKEERRNRERRELEKLKGGVATIGT